MLPDKLFLIKPFDNRLIEGLFDVCALKEAICGGVKNVTVASSEEGYLACAKRIKDLLTENGFKVETVVFGKDYDDEISETAGLFLSHGKKTVIAVGDENVISVCRYHTEKNGDFLIAVPFGTVFYGNFSPKCRFTVRGLPISIKVKLPDKIIVDPELYFKLKKHDFADAYSALSTLTADYFDTELTATLKGESLRYGNVCKKFVVAVQKLIEGVTLDNQKSTLFLAEIYAAAATYYEPDIFESCFKKAGYLLSMITGGSVFECDNRVIAPLLQIYSAYFKLAKDEVFLSNDYAFDVEELANLLKAKEIDVYETQNSLAYDEILAQKERLFAVVDTLGDEIAKLTAFDQAVKARYSFIYKGRKKRADFSREDLLKSLRLSGLFSGSGLMKLLYDDGFSALIGELQKI